LKVLKNAQTSPAVVVVMEWFQVPVQE